MVTLVFGPRGIPASYRTHAGLRRQHLQVGQRRRRDQARQVPLASRSRASSSWTEDDAAVMQGRELGVHTKDLYERDRARRASPSGTCACSSWTTTTTPSSTSTRSTTRRSWPENDFPLRHVGHDDAEPHARELLRRERADRVRHRRARRRAGLLRRQDARRPDVLLLATRSATGSARTTCSCRSTRPRTRRVAHEPARRRDDLLRRRRGREPDASTTSRRSPAACARRRGPAHAEQGPRDRGPR